MRPERLIARSFAGLFAAGLMGALIAGCAASPGRPVRLDEEARGYRGVVLQRIGNAALPPRVRPEVSTLEGVDTGLLNLLWIPWRATFGAIGFVLAGDIGPIPCTGFRWFSSETSPWILRAGEYALWEDVYASGEWPSKARPWIGRRGPDPILLPSRADP